METTEPQSALKPIPGLLALPPSDPSLYEKSRRGVVKVRVIPLKI